MAYAVFGSLTGAAGRPARPRGRRTGPPNWSSPSVRRWGWRRSACRCSSRWSRRGSGCARRCGSRPGSAPRLRSLALAGIWALLAQQAAVVTTLTLGTRVGGQGAPVVVQYAQAVYLLPYAVLAVPIATAAFPRLSHAVAQGRTGAFADAAARTTRTVVTVSLLGSAVLAGAAPAVQALFTALDAVAGGPASAVLGEGITWFAAGLAGWGLVAHVSRVLFALGRERAAAGATAAGWATVAAVSVLVVLGLRAAGTSPERAAVVGIGAGTTAGSCSPGPCSLSPSAGRPGPAPSAGPDGPW